MEKLEQKLARALATVRMPTLDSINPHFGSKYASLLSVITTVKDALNQAGLALAQYITIEFCTCQLLRVENTIFDSESGNSIVYTSQFPLSESALKDIQKLGSFITYCRRYSLLSFFGLVGEPDDDGNIASNITSGKPPAVVQQNANKSTADAQAPPVTQNASKTNAYAQANEKPSNGESSITEAQKKKLFVMMREAGLTKEESREFYKWAMPSETKDAASNFISNFYDFLDAWRETKAAAPTDDCPF